MTPKCCVINLRTYRKSCDVHHLKTRPSPRKERVFERERARYEGKATVATSVGLGNFYTLNIHHYLIHVKFWYLSVPFAIFKSLSAFLDI